MRVLSLGAGVQSTTLALMAAAGEIEPPDCAIFADTGAEPAAIYAHLDWLETVLPYPVHRVQRGNLRDDVLSNVRGAIKSGRSPNIPAFTMGKDGRGVPLMRQCTRDYKIEPIIRKQRELLGVQPGERVPKGASVEVWIGISTDEAHRMKPSRHSWATNRWPLIEAGMSRNACLAWMAKHAYPRPAKSACTFCPYHSDATWREMRDTDPVSWDATVAFDAAIRSGFRGSQGEVFLHQSLRPLSEVDLSTWAERGQGDLFGEECEGVCGV